MTDSGLDELAVVYRAGQALQVAMRHRDEYTQQHCERVAHLAALIGERCGLDATEMAALRLAAVFHDIGKIGIPDQVLLKNGPLSPDEFEVMKSHCRIGASIVAKLDSAEARLASQTILHHHEQVDGSGYPEGLAGEAIPLASRIIAVVDTFDALTSRRCYRAPMDRETAVARMSEEVGRMFDPVVYAAFLQALQTG